MREHISVVFSSPRVWCFVLAVPGHEARELQREKTWVLKRQQTSAPEQQAGHQGRRPCTEKRAGLLQADRHILPRSGNCWKAIEQGLEKEQNQDKRQAWEGPWCRTDVSHAAPQPSSSPPPPPAPSPVPRRPGCMASFLS